MSCIKMYMSCKFKIFSLVKYLAMASEAVKYMPIHGGTTAAADIKSFFSALKPQLLVHLLHKQLRRLQQYPPFLSPLIPRTEFLSWKIVFYRVLSRCFGKDQFSIYDCSI
uniref:Uncharacterized protein n=1 Tax=Noccaea caerulescens TaxID=107243 RepID=A0A1J3G285_NOCCA